MMRTRVVRLLLAPAVLVAGIAVVLGTVTPATALPPHGITVLTKCNLTTYTGTPLLCGGEVEQNVSGDTATITGVSAQINTESGPIDTGNILPDLILSFSGGSGCTNRQTSCTIPYGGSITSTPGDLGAYIVQQADYNLPGQVLSEQVTVDWTDACTGPGAFNCPAGGQTSQASSSTVVQWSDWSGPVDSDNSTPENLISVSCVSTSFCVGVDRNGDALTYNGSAWSSPSVVFDGYPSYFGAELRQVSCVSTTFCVASDDDGSVFIYNGASWSLPDPITSSPFNMGVSCASTTFCVAIAEDGGGLGFIYNGSTWTQMTIDTNSASDGMNSVSCALGTVFCAAFDDAGAAVVTTNGGTSWSPYVNVDGNTDPVISVSCATATYCLAVDNLGDAFTYSSGSAFTEGSWSSAQDIAGTNDLTSVSCTTGSNPIICYVVDNEGDFLTDAGGSWNGAVGLDPLGGLTSLSCVAPGTFCALVDSHGNGIVYTYNGNPHFTGAFIDGGPTAISAVACPSTSDCGGVDILGDAGFSNGESTFDVGKFDPGQILDTFSCGSTSFCLAADGDGGYLTYNDGNWTLKDTTDDGVTSVSCAPGTTFCAAVTEGGGADENPGPPSDVWSGAVTIDHVGALLSVSCATASFCAATDNHGNVFSYNGASWVATQDIDGSVPLTSVSCPTSSFCVAADENGYVLTTSNGGSTWSAPQLVDHDADLTSVSCASTTFCAAVDGLGDALTYNGSSWTAPVDIDESNHLNSVSCTPGTNFCVAVDNAGNALVYEAPSLSVTKTADGPTVTVGAAIGFTTTVTDSSASGTGTAAGVTLSDPLPAGTGIDWSISPAYSGPGTCSVTGVVGSQALTCSITTLAAGASASVHVSSATTVGSAGTYNNTATVSATNAPNVSASASVVVTALSPLVITTTASMIPTATDGVLYSFQLEATGGTAPYAWTVTGGSLPVGLTLSPSGVLSGTANSYPETYDFTATVNDSGSPPQTTSEPLSLVLGAPAPPPPPPPTTAVTCNGSCSTTVTTSTGTETAKGTSVGTGVIEISVATQTLECEGLDYAPQVTDVVSTVTFPAGLKVISTIDNATDAKAYLTCYSDPTAFVDAAGNLVTTGFLAACPATITDSTGPCVVSQARKHDNVVVTIHILDGDPRFWTGKAGKTGKK